jgi:hypothetical protein
MLPMLPIANNQYQLEYIENWQHWDWQHWDWQHFHIGNISTLATLTFL